MVIIKHRIAVKNTNNKLGSTIYTCDSTLLFIFIKLISNAKYTRWMEGFGLYIQLSESSNVRRSDAINLLEGMRYEKLGIR